jgi:hypothetical protein
MVSAHLPGTQSGITPTNVSIGSRPLFWQLNVGVDEIIRHLQSFSSRGIAGDVLHPLPSD